MLSTMAMPFVLTATTGMVCPCCEISHHLETCERFRNLSPSSKAVLIRAKNGCFTCLGSGHFSFNCKRKKRCGIDNCNGRHHPLLHNCPKIYPHATGAKDMERGSTHLSSRDCRRRVQERITLALQALHPARKRFYSRLFQSSISVLMVAARRCSQRSTTELCRFL